MTFPVPIEPRYNPDNLNSKRADSEWRVSHQTSNACGGYITQGGDVLLTNADPNGRWRDADAEHPVPREWINERPDVVNPQFWSPEFPELPNNAIYRYVTVWGRNGSNVFVLNDEAKAALADAQQTLVDPPPYSVPQPTGFFGFFQRLFR